ncbi:MAG: dipeptide epimerase [Aestuariivita sp.]|nr:dipeptide epimerase [Aestuariivita sp.]MCY4204082.1 dipeptide epimerase [Aestuariivita sp.]MCY4286968.1 dipeptide epimerase [Aestuariivita sp.]MCY4348004.1 dipeptide epimerase [Aestuariivita sp.]
MISISRDQFPLQSAFTISRGSRSQADVLTVTITRHGLSGRGECVPYARYHETSESVESQIRNVPEDASRDRLHEFLPPGAARNALDCAFWDLEAKATGHPVWKLAGLQPPVPAVTAYTISLGPPDQMRREATKNAHRPLLKVKLGTSSDLQKLEAVREGAPKSILVVDANEGWSPELYLDLIAHMVRLDIKLIEQPFAVSADDYLRTLSRPIPVCADESCHDRSTLDTLTGKYDFINIKLDKTGGLTEALSLFRAAREADFGIMVGSMLSSSLAIAPAVLLAQDADYVDLDGPMLLAKDRRTPLIYDDLGVHPASITLWG